MDEITFSVTQTAKCSRRSSILKPPKPRIPMQDLYCETTTVTSTKRVSFAGTQIKEFLSCPIKSTLWGSSYEENFSDTLGSNSTFNEDQKNQNEDLNTSRIFDISRGKRKSTDFDISIREENQMENSILCNQSLNVSAILTNEDFDSNPLDDLHNDSNEIFFMPSKKNHEDKVDFMNQSQVFNNSHSSNENFSTSMSESIQNILNPLTKFDISQELDFTDASKPMALDLSPKEMKLLKRNSFLIGDFKNSSVQTDIDGNYFSSHQWNKENKENADCEKMDISEIDVSNKKEMLFSEMCNLPSKEKSEFNSIFSKSLVSNMNFRDSPDQDLELTEVNGFMCQNQLNKTDYLDKTQKNMEITHIEHINNVNHSVKTRYSIDKTKIFSQNEQDLEFTNSINIKKNILKPANLNQFVNDIKSPKDFTTTDMEFTQSLGQEIKIQNINDSDISSILPSKMINSNEDEELEFTTNKTEVIFKNILPKAGNASLNLDQSNFENLTNHTKNFNKDHCESDLEYTSNPTNVFFKDLLPTDRNISLNLNHNIQNNLPNQIVEEISDINNDQTLTNSREVVDKTEKDMEFTEALPIIMNINTSNLKNNTDKSIELDNMDFTEALPIEMNISSSNLENCDDKENKLKVFSEINQSMEMTSVIPLNEKDIPPTNMHDIINNLHSNVSMKAKMDLQLNDSVRGEVDNENSARLLDINPESNQIENLINSTNNGDILLNAQSTLPTENPIESSEIIENIDTLEETNKINVTHNISEPEQINNCNENSNVSEKNYSQYENTNTLKNEKQETFEKEHNKLSSINKPQETELIINEIYLNRNVETNKINITNNSFESEKNSNDTEKSYSQYENSDILKKGKPEIFGKDHELSCINKTQESESSINEICQNKEDNLKLNNKHFNINIPCLKNLVEYDTENSSYEEGNNLLNSPLESTFGSNSPRKTNYRPSSINGNFSRLLFDDCSGIGKNSPQENTNKTRMSSRFSNIFSTTQFLNTPVFDKTRDFKMRQSLATLRGDFTQILDNTYENVEESVNISKTEEDPIDFQDIFKNETRLENSYIPDLSIIRSTKKNNEPESKETYDKMINHRMEQTLCEEGHFELMEESSLNMNQSCNSVVQEHNEIIQSDEEAEEDFILDMNIDPFEWNEEFKLQPRNAYRNYFNQQIMKIKSEKNIIDKFGYYLMKLENIKKNYEKEELKTNMITVPTLVEAIQLKNRSSQCNWAIECMDEDRWYFSFLQGINLLKIKFTYTSERFSACMITKDKDSLKNMTVFLSELLIKKLNLLHITFRDNCDIMELLDALSDYQEELMTMNANHETISVLYNDYKFEKYRAQLKLPILSKKGYMEFLIKVSFRYWPSMKLNDIKITDQKTGKDLEENMDMELKQQIISLKKGPIFLKETIDVFYNYFNSNN